MIGLNTYSPDTLHTHDSAANSPENLINENGDCTNRRPGTACSPAPERLKVDNADMAPKDLPLIRCVDNYLGHYTRTSARSQ